SFVVGGNFYPSFFKNISKMSEIAGHLRINSINN
ncbi:unnamed protein product, partial [marine sediment metagenome]